jgi:hypothetical protein
MVLASKRASPLFRVILRHNGAARRGLFPSPTKPRLAGVWSHSDLPEAGKPAAGWGGVRGGDGAMWHHDAARALVHAVQFTRARDRLFDIFEYALQHTASFIGNGAGPPLRPGTGDTLIDLIDRLEEQPIDSRELMDHRSWLNAPAARRRNLRKRLR